MKNHMGSTIALIIGALSIASGLATIQVSMLVSGFVTILGALAYRSAKNRWLNEVKQSFFRKTLEFIGMVAIIVIILLQNNVKELIASDPVPYLVIPLWAIVAYSLVAFKEQRATSPAFSMEQLQSMQNIVRDEMNHIEVQRQQIIEDSAMRGHTISVEKILRHIEELKKSYEETGNTEDVNTIERMIADFRAKYGEQIPVDVAYRLIKDIENKEYSTPIN